MPKFTVTSPDGNQFEVNAPDGATEQDAISYVQKNHDTLKALPVKGTASPPPQKPPAGALWDQGGDIARAAEDSIAALKSDVNTAFPSAEDQKEKHDSRNGVLSKVGGQLSDDAKGFGSFVKIPLDVAGLVSSPITGFLHSTAGSALSYLPGMDKQKADALVDTAGMAAGPENMAELGAGTRAIRAAQKAERTPTALAAKRVEKRFAQDEAGGGLTAQQAMDKIAQGRKEGKTLTLADVGGENVKGEAGRVARQPGASRNVAKTFLEQRDEAAGQRLEADVDKYVANGSMKRTTNSLLKARSTAAKPLYDQVKQMQGVWSPRIQEFISDPIMASGLARGMELERIDSLTAGEPFNPTQMGVDLDQHGNVVIKKTPNMRVLDMGKRGLDSMIAEERDKVTGKRTDRGVSLIGLRKAYLNEIEKMDPTGTYKMARDAWSGPSSSLDAVREGRSMFSDSPEEIAETFNNLGKNDREFFRLGVADMLKERLAKTGFAGDEAKAIIKNPWTRKQLRPIFDSDEMFNKFVDSVTTEGDKFETKRRILGGSDTASRRAEDDPKNIEAAMHAARGVGHAASLNLMGTLTSLINLRDRIPGLRRDPQLSEAIARILFDPEIQLGTQPGKPLVTPSPAHAPVTRPPSNVGNVAQTLGITTPVPPPPQSNAP